MISARTQSLVTVILTLIFIAFYTTLFLVWTVGRPGSDPDGSLDAMLLTLRTGIVFAALAALGGVLIVLPVLAERISPALSIASAGAVLGAGLATLGVIILATVPQAPVLGFTPGISVVGTTALLLWAARSTVRAKAPAGIPGR
ncbi:hypothetical protein [Sediminivirga luteola]|uniref:Uncharacterized protein n=1 Tax=Sediminivirga luteola TaxID=1774748 RepID=A0A8J2TZJ9_9MICO|nr:hypothetical protein [Sediminivirga luteola]MCI2267110.1 hypothetical protein [Sediminivirga luteola]GGA19875.1 hypothetical protein GCM10011333_23730 [Sediminivirga luteola]